MSRPDFFSMWNNFSKINVSVKEVGNKIGGKVQYNIDKGIFENAYAIRMSYALNHSGTNINRSSRWATSSGNDKKWYIYKVADLISFLEHTFGKPDISIKSGVNMSAFKNKKGIIVFNVGWRDATGHATLWNGTGCSDSCYFELAGEAMLWELK